MYLKLNERCFVTWKIILDPPGAYFTPIQATIYIPEWWIKSAWFISVFASWQSTCSTSSNNFATINHHKWPATAISCIISEKWMKWSVLKLTCKFNDIKSHCHCLKLYTISAICSSSSTFSSFENGGHLNILVKNPDCFVFSSNFEGASQNRL